TMAVEGIYDQRQHHDEVVSPVLRYWNVFEMEGLSGEGERARTELAEFMGALDESASRFTEKRDALKARLAARG
ncbi:MAG: acyl-ACP desaturase, partial [Actinomycetota bacterium]|nr:acyl-ACP desaturase [Actinomycetota bacterium]